MSEVLPPSHAREVSPEIVALVERLEDPRVASGLQNLLDHVDLLAILVIGLDGFVGRSEIIGEALAEGVSDIRATLRRLKAPETGPLSRSVAHPAHLGQQLRANLIAGSRR